MKKLSMLVLWLFSSALASHAQNITSMEKIGAVTDFSKSENGVTFNCKDNSQVQLTVLASDLIRVRTSFTKPIPGRDHSWAIAKEKWETPRWSLSSEAESITVSTDEVEVVVHRSPLLIEFRDARTHEVIN